MKAFSSAHEEYKDPHKRQGDESLEEASFKVAWAAVKNEYEKSGDKWRPKDKKD